MGWECGTQEHTKSVLHVILVSAQFPTQPTLQHKSCQFLAPSWQSCYATAKHANTHDSMPLNRYVFLHMDLPCPQLPSQGASPVQDWEKETFSTLLLYYLTITEKDRITVKHWLEGEGGVQVPAWVKPCIQPVPFFPDVVLWVCNITVSCGALSTFYSVLWENSSVPTLDPGRSSMGMASHESELVLAPHLWFHWWQGINPVVHSLMYA